MNISKNERNFRRYYARYYPDRFDEYMETYRKRSQAKAKQPSQ